MKINFFTNLDLANDYVFSMGYPHDTWTHIPSIGSRIRYEFERWDSLNNRSIKLTFELEVCMVTYSSDGQKVSVELTVPSYRIGSIESWEQYFRRHVLGSKQ